MKGLILAAGAALLLWTALPLQAQEAPPRQITVTGEGRVETRPDMAVISLGVTHEAPTAREAMAMTSQDTAAVLERLAALGVSARDVQTADLSVRPVWNTRRMPDAQPREITGFAASNVVRARLRDMATLGAVLDAVVEDGANTLSGLSFGLQEPRPFEDQARREAVSDAMDKAALFAEAAGVELGPLISLTESGGSMPRPMGLEAASLARDAVPVAEGELTVMRSVVMVFAIGG